MRKLQDHLPNRTLDEIKSQWHKLKTIFDREDKRVRVAKGVELGQIQFIFLPGNILNCLCLLRAAMIWMILEVH